LALARVDDELLELVKQHFELRPAGIIQAFNLQSLPSERGGRFYQDVAAYGHFGRTDLDLPWGERTRQRVETLTAFRFQEVKQKSSDAGLETTAQEAKKKRIPCKDSRVPWYARALAAVVVAYALSPRLDSDVILMSVIWMT